MTDPERWFAEQFEALHARFKNDKDYLAFVDALRLCIDNKRALPDWVAQVVLEQAIETFNSGSAGRGRHGSWSAIAKAKYINKLRADFVTLHMDARRRRGRVHVSEMGHFYNYGVPAPQFGGVNIVTPEHILEFASKRFRGTMAQGSPGAMNESYEAQKRGRKRQRRQGGK